MLIVFIQHQYPVLSDTYKKDSIISYKQLTREFAKNLGGSKRGIAKRSKISPNIKQLIKSTAFVICPIKQTSVAQGFF